MKFRGESDYKASFERAATCLIDAGIEDRAERIEAVRALIDEYVEEIGERPDGCILGRLTDYILREELLDKNPHKVAHGERPFLSERQTESRHEGECGLEIVSNYDTTGNDHTPSTRRRRTKKEQRAIDKATHQKRRKESVQYRRDSSPGAVVSYNLRDVEAKIPEQLYTRKNLSGIGCTFSKLKDMYYKEAIEAKEGSIHTSEFADLILADLIREGTTGEQLPVEFRERQRELRFAFKRLIAEFKETARNFRGTDGDETIEIFGDVAK